MKTCTGSAKIDSDKYIFNNIQDITFEKCSEKAEGTINDLLFCSECGVKYQNLYSWCKEILQIKKNIIKNFIDKKKSLAT